MGLAKTSWEEQERERAMGYVQQDRDKQRLALHAAEISFPHPIDGRELRCTAPALGSPWDWFQFACFTTASGRAPTG